jgi:hypothetical protein
VAKGRVRYVPQAGRKAEGDAWHDDPVGERQYLDFFHFRGKSPARDVTK